MSQGVSLYLHIPFCAKRCTYCDFTTFTDTNSIVIENYVDKICQEIESYSQFKESVNTIFWGGGTPSFLRIDFLEKIINQINKSFDTSSVSEHTIEINPVNLNRKNLAKYFDLGINRLSMGVQTFNEELLKQINRDHSVKDIYRTYQAAREAGFTNFSLDLIFGLPHQKTSDWVETLEKALALEPEHISLYGLDLHDNTPMYEQVNKGLVHLPSEDSCVEMFEYAHQFLNSKDFVHYEVSNWSKPGLQAKHNVVYWKNTPYIGVGVSASSFYKRKRYKNTEDLKDYLNTTKFKLSHPEQSHKEELEETVFMNLRLLQEGLNIDQLNKRFDIDFEDYYQKELKDLLNQNLLALSDGVLKLTEKAVFVSNEVFSAFIK